MNLSKLIIALGLLCVTSLSSSVLAHQHNADGECEQRAKQPLSMQHKAMQHKPMHRALADLDLTDSQQMQIKQLMQQHRKQYKAQQRDSSTRQQMHSLLAADSFDEVAARQLLEQQQQHRLEQRLAGLRLQHDIMQLLTVEQRQQLNEKRQSWQLKRQSRHSG